jgi:hypothetical protein
LFTIRLLYLDASSINHNQDIRPVT